MTYFGEKGSGLIFAADLPSYSQNATVIEQIRDIIDVVKINTPLLLAEGCGVIETLKSDFGVPVFADIKVADVPHTNSAIVTKMKQAGAAAVMVHGFIGPDGIDAALAAADNELGIIVQLELTSPGGRVFNAAIADDMAELMSGLPIFGFQAPGNRPKRIADIRRIVGPDPIIVCCGVGVQGGTIENAIRAGGTYAIVGRAIYMADRPAEAAARLLYGSAEIA